MAIISFRHVSKTFGGTGGSREDKEQSTAALKDISFDVNEGEFVVLLGPSGCGKTTLMRTVNRLIEPSEGEIYVHEKEIRQIPSTQLRRQIGYVIQQVGLFPHMTVAQNIAVVPKLLGWEKSRINQRIQELLELVDLDPGKFRKRYPRQLSGGQQQRVGIARAMAANPDIMLMDEPFGAIDAITRRDLQDELISIQRKVVKTVMFVTHDVEEALRLADRIAVMRLGEVVQFDSPFHLLTKPKNDFVRNLLGADDILRQLSLVLVGSVMDPLDGTSPEGRLTVQEDEDVRTALSTLIAHGATELIVLDAHGKPMGRLTMKKVLSEGAHPEELAELEV